MLLACYVRWVSAIQVKNVPPELHEELRRRAAAEGTTVGEVILEALRRDLRTREMRDWLDHVKELAPDPPVTREEVHAAWEEARAERRFQGDDDGR
jgi:plasmid stability protein